jgi:hypothetical protein
LPVVQLVKWFLKRVNIMWMGIRETVGWLIALAGLGLIGVVLILALNRNVFEAMALALPATIVFRSGIGLVRMSTAARVATRIMSEENV